MSELSLASEVSKLNRLLTKLYSRQTLGYAFFRGVFTGLGSVIGATFVVALIVFLLSKVELIPIVGAWLSRLIEQIISNLPQQ